MKKCFWRRNKETARIAMQDVYAVRRKVMRSKIVLVIPILRPSKEQMKTTKEFVISRNTENFLLILQSPQLTSWRIVSRFQNYIRKLKGMKSMRMMQMLCPQVNMTEVSNSNIKTFLKGVPWTSKTTIIPCTTSSFCCLKAKRIEKRASLKLIKVTLVLSKIKFWAQTFKKLTIITCSMFRQRKNKHWKMKEKDK